MTSTIEQLKHNDTIYGKGFIKVEDMPAFIDAGRMELILIRHSHGSMRVPAQDVETSIAMIEQWPGAYVHNLSFPPTPPSLVVDLNTGEVIEYRKPGAKQ